MNGKAILNYNRALKLAPSDDDIRYNLSIANAYVQDKIDAVPVFFAKRWLIGLGNSLSSNAWAALSLLFFALTLVGLGAYLLLRRVALQKAGFYGALVSVAAFALAVVYAAVGRSQRIHPAEAIVMSTRVRPIRRARIFSYCTRERRWRSAIRWATGVKYVSPTVTRVGFRFRPSK